MKVVRVDLADEAVVSVLVETLMQRIRPMIEDRAEGDDVSVSLIGAKSGTLERALCCALDNEYGGNENPRLKIMSWENRPHELRTKFRLKLTRLQESLVAHEVIATFQAENGTCECLTDASNISHGALVVDKVCEQNGRALIDLPGEVIPVGVRVVVARDLLQPYY